MADDENLWFVRHVKMYSLLPYMWRLMAHGCPNQHGNGTHLADLRDRRRKNTIFWKSEVRIASNKQCKSCSRHADDSARYSHVSLHLHLHNCR